MILKINIFKSLLVGIIFASCNYDSNSGIQVTEKKTTLTQQLKSEIIQKEMTPCEIAIQNIKDRDFINWQGLPSGCDWTNLTGSLPENWQRIPERSLGSNFRPTKIIMLKMEGYYEPSICFFQEKPVLFEAMNPVLNSKDSILISSLGAPETIEDWDFGTLPCPKSEYIYPQRGITLFLNTDQTKVLHIGLYKATSLKDYLENIRPEFSIKLIDSDENLFLQ